MEKVEDIGNTCDISYDSLLYIIQGASKFMLNAYIGAGFVDPTGFFHVY